MEKYYTPELEDLYIGYECEKLYSAYGGYKEEDIPRNIITKDFFIYNKDCKHLAVKYLDKNDIESLGWLSNKERTEGNSQWEHYYLEDSWELSKPKEKSIFKDDSGYIQIWWKDSNDSPNGHNYYCKSINELRKIMKYLNIIKH